MTDARIPERYLVDRRIVRLTDSERSSYFMSTLWAVSNRTDGYIDRDDLAFIPTFNESAISTLVATGLWEVTGTGWIDAEFARVQTSKDDLEVLENARRADREKKRRQRANKRDATSVPGSVPGTFPGDSTGEDRTGKDRQGQAYILDESVSENVNAQTGEVLDEWFAPEQQTVNWSTVPIPNSATTNTCRICAQPVTNLDAWGLCSKVSSPHIEARKENVASYAAHRKETAA